MSKTGKFIVFEGMDGCGKTTQSQLLSERLNSDGIKALYTNEPTNDGIGKYIREVLSKEKSVCNETLALMFAADRYEHVSKVIIPAIDSGTFVICDRYIYSSLAYQSMNSDVSNIANYNKVVKNMLSIDYIFFIDVSVEVCMKRLSDFRESYDIFETKQQLEKIEKNYMNSLLLDVKENVFRINGEREVLQISNEIFNIVKNDFVK